jgi:hypothetical protein
MSLAIPVTYDGQLQRPMAAGDTFCMPTILPATISTATNLTITGAMLANRYILRNPAGVSNENIDTAANIVAALSSGLGSVGVPNGTSWITRWIVSTANALTVQATANTGVTVTNGTINASSCKDYLITVVNGTPAQTLTCASTSGSAVITGLSLAQTSLLSVGMIVTNAVLNLQGQTILSVQPGVGVTMSGNANATSTASSIVFSPVVTVYGIGQGLI